MSVRSLMILAALLAGCGRPSGAPACGITAVAGPTMLLSEFGTPHQTLGSPPGKLPAKLVARVVAGPAYPALVGKTGEDWVVGVDGPLPPNVKPGFGVLILDPKGKALGVMVYESRPIQGAPPIGKLSAGGEMVPLLGIQLDPAKFEDPRCPFFPDSLLR